MDQEPRGPRAARWIPGWITIALLALPSALLFYTQATYGFGDEGMNNGLAYVAILAIIGLYAAWFLLASRQSVAMRLGAVVVGGLLLLAASYSVRVSGWTGSMQPILRWSWQAEPGADLAAVSLTAESTLDLASTSPTDFTGFQGSDRTGRVGAPLLARDWDASPPEELWRVPVGSGWSGFAVVNGVAVTHEQRGDDQVVVARDLATGDELWRDAHPGRYESNIAGNGPRATPSIANGRVYAQDAFGKVTCIDGADGSVVWERDLFADYGWTPETESALVTYGRSASPLVHAGRVIVPASGPNAAERRAGIVCLDGATGETVWEGPPRHFSHGSPVRATLCDVEQIVVPNEASVSGHDPTNGTLLWEVDWPGQTGAAASNSNPTIVGDDRVLVSKGYGQGSMLFSLSRAEDGTFTTEELWASRRSLQTKLTNPVVFEGHGYGLSDGILECVSLETGRRVWKEGRHGHGQLLLVEQGDDALLLILSEQGDLMLVEASPESEGEVLARQSAFDRKTWNTFALVGDVVVVRNDEEAACYRLPTVER